MQDILKNKFPYSMKHYDSKFINKIVLGSIIDYCKKSGVIESFHVKGSLAHGCMVKGSDIDHVRIKVKEKLSLIKKIQLIDRLESRLTDLGVSELKRIREDDYVRIFYEWNELKNVPYAHTQKFKIYPNMHIMTAKNKEEWFRKIVRTGYNYSGKISERWINKMKERVF